MQDLQITLMLLLELAPVTKRSTCCDAKLSDVCISTSAPLTYLSAHYFKVEDGKGNVREHHLIDGDIAANNPGKFGNRFDRTNS
ncbi:hypothetical protein KY289_021762 [Solanum tuberosum]|nr:hypothetical protein KY289_021762 [Solanum tuberosum]